MVSVIIILFHKYLFSFFWSYCFQWNIIGMCLHRFLWSKDKSSRKNCVLALVVTVKMLGLPESWEHGPCSLGRWEVPPPWWGPAMKEMEQDGGDTSSAEPVPPCWHLSEKPFLWPLPIPRSTPSVKLLWNCAYWSSHRLTGRWSLTALTKCLNRSLH